MKSFKEYLTEEDYSHIENHPLERMREYTDAEFPWEHRELEKYAPAGIKAAFKGPEHFKSEYDKAPMRHLTPDELKNLDYSTAGSYLGNEPGKLERALRHFAGHRDLDRIQNQLKTSMPPPIVIKHSKGMRILGGNTRLSLSLAANKNLPVKIVDISDRY